MDRIPGVTRLISKEKLSNNDLTGSAEGIPTFADLLYKQGSVSVKNGTTFINDLTGRYVSEINHEFRNAHLVGDGTTDISFYAGLDTKWIRYYNVDTLAWVEVAYNHSTGLVLANGLKVLEMYTENGDVYTCEELGFTRLFNLEGSNHATINASGATLDTFRAGRNDLVSQWADDYRGKNMHSYGYTTQLGTTGAVTLSKLYDPTPLKHDVVFEYDTVTSPLYFDLGNSEADGSGNGYGFRVRSDKYVEFYRKDAGVVNVLDTTSNTYASYVRTVIEYNEINDKFAVKYYQIGESNPDDTANIFDSTYPYPASTYIYIDLPNGDESVSLVIDDIPADVNDGTWTATGTIAGYSVPSKCVLSADELPVIKSCDVTDEEGNRLDAIGGLLEYQGRIKAELQLVNASAIKPNGTDNTMTLTHANVANIDNIKAYILDTTWQEVTSYTDLYSISGTTLTLFNDTGYFGKDIVYFKAYDSSDTLLFDIYFNSHKSLADDNKILSFDRVTGTQLELLGTIVAGNIVTQDKVFANFANGFKLFTKDTDGTELRTPTAVTSVTGYTLQSTNIAYADRIINAENQYQMCREPRIYNSPILENSVANGDFSNGTTGWTIGGVDTPIVVGGKLRLNRAGTIPYAKQLIKVSENDVIYIYAEGESTGCEVVFNIGNNATNYDGALGGTLTTFNAGTKTLSKKITLSGTPGATNNFSIYPTTSSVQVDLDEIVYINMTALGIASYTEAKMLEFAQNGYFDAKYIVDANGDMAELDYEDFLANFADQSFMKIDSLSKYRLLWYSQAQTNSALTRAENYTGQ